MTARTTKWPLFAALAIFLLVVLSQFYWPFLDGSRQFYLFDFTFNWEPYLHFMSAQIAAHQFPMWNPYANCGCPEIAIMAPSFFYPGNWLFPYLSFSQAMASNLVINQLAAGLGMFLLLDSLDFGLWGALAGGLIYSLGGLEFSLQTTYSLQSILAWFPWTLWGLNHISATDSSRRLLALWFALTCLFVYLLVSAGMPEMSALCLIGGLLFSCGILLKTGSLRTRLLRLLLQVFALVSGTLLCAPQALPLVEWVARSPRSVGLSVQDMMHWSASWYDIAGLVLPEPLGSMFAINNPYHTLVQSDTQPYIDSVMVGPTVLTAAGWGIGDRRFRARFWLVALALLSIALALGSNSQFAMALPTITGLKLVRYPIKLLCFAVIPICVLAARGFHAGNLSGRTAANRLVALLWMALLLAALLLDMCAQGIFGHSKAVEDLLSAMFFPGNPSDLIFPAAQLVAESACLTSIVGLLTCLISYLQYRRKISFSFFSLVVLILCVGQLIAFAFRFQYHAAEADFFTKPLWLAQAIRKLQPTELPGSMTRICTVYRTINAPRNRVDIRNLTATNYLYDRQMLVPASNMDAGLGSTLYFATGETLEHYRIKGFALQQHHLSNDLPLAMYLRGTSTTFALTQARMVSEQALLTTPAPALDPRFFKQLIENLDWNLRVYAVKDPLPRAYFARQVKWGAPHTAVLTYIQNSDQSHFDPGQLTVLEHARQSEKGIPVQNSMSDVSASRVTFKTDTADKVELEVFTPKPNYLVLTDEFYPGWHASVDGQSVQIYRANAFERAVLVASGKHNVRFVYEPESLKIGLYGAAFVLLLQLLVVVWLGCGPRSGACCKAKHS
jgi:hypothetical protein